MCVCNVDFVLIGDRSQSPQLKIAGQGKSEKAKGKSKSKCCEDAKALRKEIPPCSRDDNGGRQSTF